MAEQCCWTNRRIKKSGSWGKSPNEMENKSERRGKCKRGVQKCGLPTHDIYAWHNPLTQQDNKMSTRTFLIRSRYNNLYAWHVSARQQNQYQYRLQALCFRGRNRIWRVWKQRWQRRLRGERKQKMRLVHPRPHPSIHLKHMELSRRTEMHGSGLSR